LALIAFLSSLDLAYYKIHMGLQMMVVMIFEWWSQLKRSLSNIKVFRTKTITFVPKCIMLRQRTTNKVEEMYGIYHYIVWLPLLRVPNTKNMYMSSKRVL
jgi:hypothetical protein